MSKPNINPVIRTLIVQEFFYNAALSAFAPILAVFIINDINGGSVEVAGFAAALYWIVKSPIQLWTGRLLDRLDGEADFWAAFFGHLGSALLLFGYIFAREYWHLYLIAALNGICMSWAVPAWYRLFTRHIDKWEIGFEWSLESTFSVGLSTAAAAAGGGLIATRFGFGAVFFISGLLGVIAATSFFFAKPYLVKGSVARKVLPERHLHSR